MFWIQTPVAPKSFPPAKVPNGEALTGVKVSWAAMYSSPSCSETAPETILYMTW